MFELLESFIIGLISGIISSIIVTMIFRSKDRVRAGKEYIGRLMMFLSEFVNAYNRDHDHEGLIRLKRLTETPIPKRDKFMKFPKQENRLVTDMLEGYQRSYIYLLNYVNSPLWENEKITLDELNNKIIDFLVEIQRES